MPSTSYTEATETQGVSNTRSTVTVGDAPENKYHWDWSSRHSRVLIGCLITLATGVAWVAFSELVQDTKDVDGFNAPFALTYLFVNCLIILFPVSLFVACLINSYPARDVFRECLLLYSENDGFGRLRFLWMSSLFCLIAMVTMYTYIRALHKLGAADCVALYAANHSFVYLLSWIVLFEKFIAMRIFAMIFSITGIVLFAYVDGFGSPAMIGVVLGVSSSAGAAVYQVLYKKFVGVVSGVAASFFLTILGLFSLILLWPVCLLLYFLEVEQIIWSHVPWTLIIPGAVLTTVCSGVRECTTNLTYSVFVGMGFVLAVPLCTAADTVWKGREFSGMKIAALVLITIGVLLILLPENWHDCICKHVQNKRKESEHSSTGHGTTLRSRLSRTTYM